MTGSRSGPPASVKGGDLKRGDLKRGDLKRGDLLRLGRDRLVGAGIIDAESDARLLLRHVLDLSALELVTGASEPVAQTDADRFHAQLDRRCHGEPVGRIMGRRDFWGLSFALSAETLEPRPDSEAVIALALALNAKRRQPFRTMLDLGTGTGCLLLALLHEWPAAHGTGCDISADAANTARNNARALGLDGRATLIASGWAGLALPERFDLIVSNPPYIERDEIARLDREVRLHDPARALDGGPDGLAAYRDMIPRIDGWLAPHGVLILEIGAGQASAVTALAQQSGLRLVETRHDLGSGHHAGHARALAFVRAPA